ncbi:MAG: ABC transporter permease [bacterium]|nr:ABC transporter permease [bacterium]MDE0131531.1 ABC transporter permease [bacterium]
MTAVSRSASPKAARGRRSFSLMIGAGLLGVIVVLAILAPWITPHDPLAHNLDSILAPPSSDYLLGTDHLGRDVWTRLLYAARLDLLIGVGAVITPFVTGTLLGAVAGYYGGRIDLAVSAATDMLFAFPYYVLIIALVFSLGPGIPSIFIAMAIVAWVSYARIVRGEVLSARGQQYVMAAKTLGYSDLRIIVRHILPNVITQPVTYAMSDIVVIIVGVVTLSYLGLGVPPPTPDWGSMIASGQSYLTTQWQLSTIPGIAVVIVGLSFSLIGDGLTHRLRPE